MNFLHSSGGGVQIRPDYSQIKFRRKKRAYSRFNFRCHRWKIANVVDSNGDRVNVGNFDESGLNVNNWNDHDRNDNLGVSSSRNFILATTPRVLTRRFAYFRF